MQDTKREVTPMQIMTPSPIDSENTYAFINKRTEDIMVTSLISISFTPDGESDVTSAVIKSSLNTSGLLRRQSTSEQNFIESMKEKTVQRPQTFENYPTKTQEKIGDEFDLFDEPFDDYDENEISTSLPKINDNRGDKMEEGPKIQVKDNKLTFNKKIIGNIENDGSVTTILNYSNNVEIQGNNLIINNEIVGEIKDGKVNNLTKNTQQINALLGINDIQGLILPQKSNNSKKEVIKTALDEPKLKIDSKLVSIDEQKLMIERQLEEMMKKIVSGKESGENKKKKTIKIKVNNRSKKGKE